MFKALLSRFKAPFVNVAKIKSLKQLQVIEILQKENRIAGHMITEFRNELVDREQDVRLLMLENEALQDQQLKDKREIEALKAIVSNLRKQKVYAGQKFYNPEDHRAPTVYLCARWNDWYIVRQSNELTPHLITAKQWKETYGHLVVLPQMNSNLKNLS